jgi:hypothetical protein
MKDRLCCLVIVGVRPDGHKELVAVADGYRESTESWAELLRDLKDRGLRAPTLAVGDGALGFWNALRDVFDGKTREQRCWVHKTANVLDALPKRLHPEAKKAIHAIYLAETRGDALDRVAECAEAFDQFPKAVAKITGELDTLLAFYGLPGRALEAPEKHQRHRLDLRHRTTPDQGDQRSRQPPSRPGHGPQAGRRRPAAVAPNRRIPAGSPGPSRSPVHRRTVTREEFNRPDQPRGRRRLTMNPIHNMCEYLLGDPALSLVITSNVPAVSVP